MCDDYLILIPTGGSGWIFRTGAGSYRTGTVLPIPAPQPAGLRSQALFDGSNRETGIAPNKEQNPRRHTANYPSKSHPFALYQRMQSRGYLPHRYPPPGQTVPRGG